MDINKIVLSNKVSLGRKDFKYYIGYKDAKKIRPLCIFLPQMGAYRRDFDETKSISLNYLTILIKDDELLGKYNKIGKKFSNIFKKNLTVNLCTMKNI